MKLQYFELDKPYVENQQRIEELMDSSATGMLKNPIPSSPAGFWESSVRFCVNQEPL